MVLKCGRCWCDGVPPKAVIPPRIADDQFQSHEIEWIACQTAVRQVLGFLYQFNLGI